MFTFELTICALIAIFSVLAIITDKLVDYFVDFDEEEGIDYGIE